MGQNDSQGVLRIMTHRAFTGVKIDAQHQAPARKVDWAKVHEKGSSVSLTEGLPRSVYGRHAHRVMAMVRS